MRAGGNRVYTRSHTNGEGRDDDGDGGGAPFLFVSLVVEALFIHWLSLSDALSRSLFVPYTYTYTYTYIYIHICLELIRTEWTVLSHRIELFFVDANVSWQHGI